MAGRRTRSSWSRTACASGWTRASASAAASSSGSASASAASSGKHYTIAYVPGATGVAFYDTLVAGMKAKAAALGMSVTYQGSPNFAAASQTPIVDAICTEHPV